MGCDINIDINIKIKIKIKGKIKGTVGHIVALHRSQPEPQHLPLLVYFMSEYLS